MLRLLLAIWLILTGVAGSAAADDAAKLGKLPTALALTRSVEGEWPDEDDLLSEAYEAVQGAAQERGLALGQRRIVIYQEMNLKTFKARVGFLLDGLGKPTATGQVLELRPLPAVKAWVTSGQGEYSAIIAARRRVLDEVEKPGVKRLKGVEIIQIHDGDPEREIAPFEVYAPLAR